jgi:hypothetical protein
MGCYLPFPPWAARFVPRVQIAKTRLNAVCQYLAELCKLDEAGASRQVLRFGGARAELLCTIPVTPRSLSFSFFARHLFFCTVRVSPV